MTIRYTPADVSILATIRADILARPDAYRDGDALLRTEYAPDRLHKNAVTEWDQVKDLPANKAWNQQVAKDLTMGISAPTKRKARFHAIVENSSVPPRLEDFTPAARLSHAIHDMLGEQGLRDPAKYQAILLLAVMLWDKKADKCNSIFDSFGPWEPAPAQQGKLFSRSLATDLLSGEDDSKRWMEVVKMAWNALPRPEGGTAGVKPGRLQRLCVTQVAQKINMNTDTINKKLQKAGVERVKSGRSFSATVEEYKKAFADHSEFDNIARLIDGLAHEVPANSA